MKVTLVRGVLFALLFVSITLACEKGNTLEKAELRELQEIASMTGVVHNAALDYLAKNVDLSRTNEREMFLVLNDYFIQNASSSEAREALKQYREDGCNCQITNISSVSEWIDENANAITAQEKEYLLLAGEELEKYLSKGVTFVAQGIRAIQEDVLLNTQITYLSKKKLLGTLSILASSIEYWDDAYYDIQHPWHDRMASGRVCTPCLLLALADAMSYTDCLSNGGIDDPSTAGEVCLNQGAYASAVSGW
ncbi:MAG: hypothetical protein R2795_23950 [Saprospiraceae bacterium]